MSVAAEQFQSELRVFQAAGGSTRDVFRSANNTFRSFDPVEVILPQVRGGRGSFYNRGRFCSQCVYLSLDVHEESGPRLLA